MVKNQITVLSQHDDSDSFHFSVENIHKWPPRVRQHVPVLRGPNPRTPQPTRGVDSQGKEGEENMLIFWNCDIF